MAELIQGNETVFAIIKQTGEDSGVPATPAFNILRRTSGNIEQVFNYTQSDLVDPTRQGREQIKTGEMIEGDMDSELAIADTVFHEIIEGAIQGEFGPVTAFNGATISFDNTGVITDSGATAFTDVVEGQYFSVTGSASNDGVYRTITKNSNGEVVVDRATVTEAAGATIDIKGKMARNGKNRIAFTIQKRIPSAGDYKYITMQGCQISSLTFNVSSASLLTTSFSIIGLDQLDQDTAVAGQTDNAEVVARVLGAIDGVEQVWVDNVPAPACDQLVTDASITIDNGSEGLEAVGCQGYVGISHSAIDVTGTYNTYAKDADPLAEKTKADNQTLFSLAYQTKDQAGNRMIITRDSTMYTSLEQPDTANGDTVINNGSVSSDGKNNVYLTTIQFDYIPA